MEFGYSSGGLFMGQTKLDFLDKDKIENLNRKDIINHNYFATF